LDLRSREPRTRDVSISFYRREWQDRSVGVRLSAGSFLADDLAAKVEEALHLPPGAGQSDVKAVMVCNGTSFPIGSARLSGVGEALFDRAGSFF
jgi:hypothetical protein